MTAIVPASISPHAFALVLAVAATCLARHRNLAGAHGTATGFTVSNATELVIF
ncbi:MAG: hypothetical protein ACI9SE_001459 [Neolewinella sp.]|jgi:hypothetical protein